MPIHPCRECGQDISNTATICPHCGVKFPSPELYRSANKVMTITLTIFVSITLILFASFLSHTVGRNVPSSLTEVDRAREKLNEAENAYKDELMQVPQGTPRNVWTKKPSLVSAERKMERARDAFREALAKEKE